MSGDLGYSNAFYNVASIMGISAQNRSPKEVWEQEMRPRLVAAFAKPAMADTFDIKLVERLRADAATIRAHVPDADGSYLPVARSASEPERQMVAGPLHADMLEYAADRIERLAADIAARDTLWRAWLAREGISYDKGPDGMPKGWGKPGAAQDEGAARQ